MSLVQNLRNKPLVLVASGLVVLFLSARVGMFKSLKKLVRGEQGASLVEYTLLLVLIAVVAITAVGTLGNTVSNQMGNVKNAVD